MRKLRSELRAKWHELVSEQGQSGQTVKAFCLERGIRDSLFYDRKKRLRESELEKFVEVKVIRAEERAQRSAFSGKPIAYSPFWTTPIVRNVAATFLDTASPAHFDHLST